MLTNLSVSACGNDLVLQGMVAHVFEQGVQPYHLYPAPVPGKVKNRKNPYSEIGQYRLTAQTFFITISGK